MKRLLVFFVFLWSIANAQDAAPPPKPSDAKSLAPTASAKSRVDEVIEAVRAHVPDKEILASLRKDKKPIDLSLGDKTKLKNAGVSDSVIEAMQDPSGSATTPAAASHAAEPGPVDDPTPKADDSGPNLEATMKFIRDKLNGQGKVNWRETWQVSVRPPNAPPSDSDGTPTMNLIYDEVSDAQTDISACTLSARELYSSSDEKGQAVRRKTHKFSFRDIDRLVVEVDDDGTKRSGSDLGSNGETVAITVKDVPPVFKLRVVMNSGKKAHVSVKDTGFDGKTTDEEGDSKEDAFYFQDEEAAQRLAKAMVHAVELCGGDKDPFK
jgi:hypothetical protein